jgi:hypothetical protein
VLGGGQPARDRPGSGSGGPGLTDEQGSLTGGAPELPPDLETLRRAREIAARLAVPRPRRSTSLRAAASASSPASPTAAARTTSTSTHA